MKACLPLTAFLAGFLLLGVLTSSCKKTDVAGLSPKEDLVLGKWNINRIQLRIYYGGVFFKDTIIKQTPMPENFVNLGSNGSFEYRFNTSTSDLGTYTFSGADVLVSNSNPNSYNWKILTLTKDIFTVVSVSYSDAFYPGAMVETYQTFVRYK